MKLTKAEEEIMQILWTIQRGTVQDLLKGFKKNKPARTTVATMLSILESKNFVAHETEGRSNIYYPLVKKEDYSEKQLFGILKDYFDGSFSSLASCFIKKTDMKLEDLDQLIRQTKDALEQENNKK